MNDASVGNILLKLREKKGLSQSELAKRLPYTASRISRLESGEITASTEEAQQFAEAIASDDAMAFAQYLGWSWQVLPQPSFDHPSLMALWKAEQALHRLDGLVNDPDIKNAFLKEVESCREALERAATFLGSNEHSIVFIGGVNAGKTTAICALSGLRNEEKENLQAQIVMPTSTGRTTACEVHVRTGGEYAIAIEPCSEHELDNHIADFCDYLLNIARGDKSNREGGGSYEMARVLTNMTGLKFDKIKQDDGTTRYAGAALDFVNRYSSRDELQRDELQNEILGMLQRRRRKSISFPSTSSIPELEWLSKTIKDINFGLQEDFSLPSRIEVSIPKSMPILGTEAEALNIRLIDTRGIDEPSAHREELQDYLDDDRAIIVLCSKFGDAPSADIQALIEKSTQIDLRTKLLEQGLLLVLPREGEEARMVDMTGEPVASPEEGREFRRDQATMTLIDLDMRELPIEFLNVENEDDCKRSKEVLLQLVLSVRQRTEEQVDSLTETVDGLIRDYDNKDVKGCFDVATPPLKRWCANNTVLADIPHRIDVQIDPYRIDPYRIDAALLEAMAQVHVQSLRKSVKCQGEWYKFAYWPSLGFGARRTAVARSKGQLLNLRVFVRVFLDDSKYESTHNFLRHFLLQIDREANAFVIAVQQMCQTAFAKQLKKDGEYWRWCEERWPGTGYRDDVGLCTKRWFDATGRKAKHEFIEAQIQRLWKEMVESLAEQLSTIEVDVPVAAERSTIGT